MWWEGRSESRDVFSGSAVYERSSAAGKQPPQPKAQLAQIVERVLVMVIADNQWFSVLLLAQSAPKTAIERVEMP